MYIRFFLGVGKEIETSASCHVGHVPSARWVKVDLIGLDDLILDYWLLIGLVWLSLD